MRPGDADGFLRRASLPRALSLGMLVLACAAPIAGCGASSGKSAGGPSNASAEAPSNASESPEAEGAEQAAAAAQKKKKL
ncbi:MAG TPA: hypothetical protein VK272_03220, partial [Solirubrobacteraceae bacterium]|nr:hypothetical protein [Solirubrobacteraceae bacterium]